MRFRMAPLTATGLLALAAVNAWLLTILMRDPEPRAQDPVVDVASSTNLSEISGGPLATRPTAAYRETLAHPVFYKGREPFVPPPPPPPPAAATPTAPPPPADPGIALGGVAIDSVLRKAYLFNKANPQGTWVSQGEIFMGWTVQAIDATSTKLRQSDRTLELQLYERR